MYGLIQTDEISKIFEERARKTDRLEAPQWGADTQKVQESAEQFSAMMKGKLKAERENEGENNEES